MIPVWPKSPNAKFRSWKEGLFEESGKKLKGRNVDEKGSVLGTGMEIFKILNSKLRIGETC